MSTTTLTWNKVDDRTWQAGGLGCFYEIRRYTNPSFDPNDSRKIVDRDHYSLFRRFPENPSLNTQYIVSVRDIEYAKVRAQQHLNELTNRLPK